MPAELPPPAPSTTLIPDLPISEPGQPASVSNRRAVRRGRPAASWLLALLLLLLSGAATTARAQTTQPPECSQDEKFANTWYFGYKAGLDFNQATDSIPPKVLTDGAMDAPAGSGVMSDGTGKILFYSNGETVWNGDGTVMTELVLRSPDQDRLREAADAVHQMVAAEHRRAGLPDPDPF